MRAFIATLLSPAAQQWATRTVRDFVEQAPRVLRGIPSDSAHLTHVFFAALDVTLVDRVVDAMRRATTARPAFDIRLAGLLALPPGPRPRLVAADVLAGAVEVRRLSEAIAAEIRTACPALPFDRSRSAHVTLARFRRGAREGDVRAATARLAEFSRTRGEQPDRIDHVALIRSTVDDRGPVYDVLVRVPLARGMAFIDREVVR